ncbi:ABC transporter ATP-binding protein [Reichenbachiella versicolor]|uniref:ABC transporter ATP-binding protein n=1 Tax=Reichenbachiella versicolor TaxID=1821036 RepID=UPI000D6EA627|nr:ABC transporter ATP-binding protein [Reichenbachiella versicolor]
MIELSNVEKVYQTKEIETLALNQINLKIEKGEFASIMGPSGCGKSTLLNVMGLLDMPSTGSVRIQGEKVTNRKETKLAEFRNQNLGFIFQSFHLVNDLTVYDNVEMPLLYRKGISSKERKERIMSVLEKVGLSARVHHYPSQLSGGQKQRVAIARAIIGSPEIILADEPTGNLDSRMGHEIMDLLMELNKEGTTIVMVTHDEALAQKTNRIIRLFDGSLVN